MSFRLTVSDSVLVPIKGRLQDGAGAAALFDFSLVARRLAADELRRALDETPEYMRLLPPLITDWSGVLDDEGKPVPFSPTGVRQLLDIIGMAALVFESYLEACSPRAKEKN